MKEAKVPEFKDEVDLLRKTLEFYNVTKDRFVNEMDSVNDYMKDHFKARWDIDKDLYLEAIENQMNYLKSILENHGENFRAQLKRGGLVKKFNRIKIKLHNESS